MDLMKKRKVSHRRKTKETDITMNLVIEGSGKGDVKTPIPFLSHLLENFAKHGSFDLKVRAKGDIELDQHHTVEDMGLVLGEIFKEALGNKKGINRAGYFVFPMDEALSLVAVDIANRAYLHYEVKFTKEKVGDLETDLLKHFFESFSRSLGATLHIRLFSGEYEHHKAESIFKGFGKAMKMACSRDKKMIDEIPSTKEKL